jgi:hypothetical protein
MVPAGAHLVAATHRSFGLDHTWSADSGPGGSSHSSNPSIYAGFSNGESPVVTMGNTSRIKVIQDDWGWLGVLENDCSEQPYTG